MEVSHLLFYVVGTVLYDCWFDNVVLLMLSFTCCSVVGTHTMPFTQISALKVFITFVMLCYVSCEQYFFSKVQISFLLSLSGFIELFREKGVFFNKKIDILKILAMLVNWKIITMVSNVCIKDEKNTPFF